MEDTVTPKGDRKAYAPPTIIEHGSVVSVTAGDNDPVALDGRPPNYVIEIPKAR